MIEDLNLRETMEINYIAHPMQTPKKGDHYDYIEPELVWELIDSAEGSVNTEFCSLDTSTAILWISVKIPWLEPYNTVMYVFEDHMVTDITDFGEWFNIAPDLIADFIGSVMDQCDQNQ